MWLEAPVIEEDEKGRKTGHRLKKGTPQGGVSPLLANSFLHWFDRSFYGTKGPARWANARLVPEFVWHVVRAPSDGRGGIAKPGSVASV